jgi:hypothetical protein
MNTPNKDSMRWHPAAGHIRTIRPVRRGDVVDLATARAIRLLADAGMIPVPAVPRRRRTVR